MRGTVHELSLRIVVLARTGADGIALGYAAHEKSAGEKWPDTFDASDLELVAVEPGVVYGTYRYRVRYGADEESGIFDGVGCTPPATLM